MSDANMFASTLKRMSASMVVGLICLLVIGVSTDGAGRNADDSNGDNIPKYYMRSRVGNFARYRQELPIANLYTLYFDHVLKHTDRTLTKVDIEDWRRFRPTGYICITTLKNLVIQSYVPIMPFDLIVIDGCLDWLFGEEDKADRQRDVKSFNDAQKGAYEEFRATQGLKDLYTNTAFFKKPKENGIPMELVDQIYKYFETLVKIFDAKPDLTCHGLWLQAYADFMENVYLDKCVDEDDCEFYGLDVGKTDSYLNLIAQSTIKAAKNCYGIMHKQMRTPIMDLEFNRAKPHISFSRKIVKFGSLDKQLERERWTRDLANVLQMVQGSSDSSTVDLGAVAATLVSIKDNPDELTNEVAAEFLGHLAKYAKNNAEADNTADFSGLARYARSMEKLCSSFIEHKKFIATLAGLDVSDGASPMNYYTIVYSMVRLANHEAIFGISLDDFEQSVQNYNWAPLYLATFTCHIIQSTHGQLDAAVIGGSYTVKFSNKVRELLYEWPIDGLGMNLQYNNVSPGKQPQKARKSRKLISRLGGDNRGQFNIDASVYTGKGSPPPTSKNLQRGIGHKPLQTEPKYNSERLAVERFFRYYGSLPPTVRRKYLDDNPELRECPYMAAFQREYLDAHPELEFIKGLPDRDFSLTCEEDTGPPKQQ